ncbi:MAG: hypothetical protein DHS20C11_03460 [Lysobacteraceae bacterium]|nr:MAG: hypothetical protein DHS20C11_03460 [Xanthomonadaceae bacterium]
MTKTAAELMAELEKKPEFIQMRQRQNERFIALGEIYREDEAELLKDLSEVGIEVGSVWDLVNAKNDYFVAVPVLLKHLNKAHHPKTTSGIARALAIPKLSENDELWNSLASLYSKTRPDRSIAVPEERGCQEALAIALETISSPARLSGLRALVEENPEGDCIDLLKSRLAKLEST